MSNKQKTKIINKQNEEFFDFIYPNYTEITLLLIAITFVFLFASNLDLRSSLSELSTEFDPVMFTFLGILSFLGLMLSIIHPFISRKKNFFEKTVMALFVIVVNGGIGLYAGYTSLFKYDKQYIIFPVINILFSFFVSISLVGANPEKSVSDENASPFEVITSIISLIIIFFFCTYVLKPHWTIVFSICVSYSIIAQRTINKIYLLFSKFVLHIDN